MLTLRLSRLVYSGFSSVTLIDWGMRTQTKQNLGTLNKVAIQEEKIVQVLSLAIQLFSLDGCPCYWASWHCLLQPAVFLRSTNYQSGQPEIMESCPIATSRHGFGDLVYLDIKCLVARSGLGLGSGPLCWQKQPTRSTSPLPPIGIPVSYTHLTLPTICSV